MLNFEKIKEVVLPALVRLLRERPGISESLKESVWESLGHIGCSVRWDVVEDVMRLLDTLNGAPIGKVCFEYFLLYIVTGFRSGVF